MHSIRPRYVDAWEEARPLVAMLEIAARLPSLSIEVFLRRNFGERYLTGGLAVASGLFVHAVCCAIAGVSPLEWRGASIGTMLFLVAFAGLSLGHLYEIARRNRNGFRWYSWSDGVSWRLWNLLPFRHHVVQARLEPLLVLLCGCILLTVDRVLGLYLIGASVVFFLKAGRTLQRRRDAWLDYVDKTIESEELDATLLERRPARETRGLVVATGGAVHRRALEEMARVLRSTDDGLKALAEVQSDVARIAREGVPDETEALVPSPHPEVPAPRLVDEPRLIDDVVLADDLVGGEPLGERGTSREVDDWARAFLQHRRRERRRRSRPGRPRDDVRPELP